MKKILYNNNLSSNEKLVLFYLIFNSVNNQVKVFNEKIANDLNITVRTVYFCLRKLKESNYIRIENYTSKRIINIIVDFE